MKIDDLPRGDPNRPIRVRVAGTESPWIYGLIIMASENRKSLLLEFDEGLPLADAGIMQYSDCVKQVLPLLHSVDNIFVALMSQALYEVEFREL